MMTKFKQKKIIYTRPEDNGLSVIIPSDKEDILLGLKKLNKCELLAWIEKQIEKKHDHDSLMIYQTLPNFVEYNFKGHWEEEFEDALVNKIVWSSVPKDAINPREIEDTDLPTQREFRHAWCDVTPESRVDIDLSKAKELKLSEMRKKRQKEFEKLGFPNMLHPELEKSVISPETRDKLQALRDVTEPLKSLVVSGYNDEEILNKIRELGSI